MATLKGQNFRLYVDKSVVAMATSCTVTLTGNTETAETKNDVGGASKPEIVSKGWSAQVESLDVTDMGVLLNAVKQMKPFTVKWDESAFDNNQDPQCATFARQGQAYINDLNFTFNDRTNASKSIQLSGTGPLDKYVNTDVDITSTDSFTKGQNVRLFLSKDDEGTHSPIAAAMNLSVHVSVSLETSTTKDSVGDWIVQEPTGYTFDISSSALVRSGEKITSAVDACDFAEIEELYESSKPVSFEIANVGGDNNRNQLTMIMAGYVIITQLTVSAANKTNVTYDTQLQGYGEYLCDDGPNYNP